MYARTPGCTRVGRSCVQLRSPGAPISCLPLLVPILLVEARMLTEPVAPSFNRLADQQASVTLLLLALELQIHTLPCLVFT